MSHKNPIMETYLDFLRQRNIEKAKYCRYCKKQSTGINSDGYRLFFVCDDHLDDIDDVILDTSDPKVIHYTYPNGKRVTEKMMDPNVGGLIPRKSSIEMDGGRMIPDTDSMGREKFWEDMGRPEDTPRPEEEQADIWSTQTSFEE